MVILVSRYNPLWVSLSVIVAVFASFVALDLASSVTRAKGYLKMIWLVCGALAMGLGIWSMHFVGMLAFDIPGVPMSYDLPLMMLSILIAVIASALALFIVSRQNVTVGSVIAGGIAMAAAIAGMHYTGMYSMRMPAKIYWNQGLIVLSILIALGASFAALLIAIRLRKVIKRKQQLLASVIMGFAISGMHYTGMSAATFVYAAPTFSESHVWPSSNLAIAVLITTSFILSLALIGALIDRAFGVRKAKAEKMAALYREAKTAISALRKERELRERFVSGLAHDLRTPITAAKMSAQLSIRQSTNPEAVEKLYRRVTDNLDRMDLMIQNLLDAHRISAGQALPLNIVECDLNDLLQNMFEDLITVHGQRFVIQRGSGLKGYWDPQYLRRAVENLCANAVKYGKEGTPITVKTLKSSKERIQISVHNQGEAISESEQHDLFGLFHRSKTAEATGKKGWGLGLTIVRGIAEAHGGSVQVKSSNESGTTFTIELPIDSR